MDSETREAFRRRIEAMLAELAAAEAGTAEDRRPVALDQQSVGRLARMDAMQVQAMATAQSRRRAAEATRLRAALARFDDDEFGYCQRCGEEIALRRLELDPATPFCIACARG